MTSAVEGTAYTYQLAATDPAGGAVTFALTTAPAGAALSGNTITWAPTSPQSRVANNFTVTATTKAGGSTTQSWSVTPNGTVRISWIDTRWDADGSTLVPYDWTPVSSFVAALVPKADGSFETLLGSGGADGQFSIPNVPSGYYWLRVSPRGIYWTNSSTFDFGGEYWGGTSGGSGTVQNSTLSLNVTGLEPTSEPTFVDFLGWHLPVRLTAPAGATTAAGGMIFSSNINLSGLKTANVVQYKPVAFGTEKGYVLGPALTLTDVGFTSGTTNTISAALVPSPAASIDLSIKGTAWAPLFDHVAPGPPGMLGSAFRLTARQWVGDNEYVSGGGSVDLIWSAPAGPTRLPWSIYDPCGGGSLNGFDNASLAPVLLTDQDIGTVQYGDPFPATWTRYISFCQKASIQLPIAGSGGSATFELKNSLTMAPRTGPIVPLVGPVQTPTINDASLFTASTISNKLVTLKWSAPTVGTPTGYSVQVLTPSTTPSGIATYSSVATFGTAKTTVTLPSGVFVPGQTYVFRITAIVDGRANMETSPRRSALPLANADVVSAPMVYSPAAQ